MNRKIKGKRFLVIEYANPLWFYFFQLGITLSNQVKKILQYQWLSLPSVLWVVGILFLVRNSSSKEDNREHQNQYQLI
jgi:hypothetical protein